MTEASIENVEKIILLVTTLIASFGTLLGAIISYSKTRADIISQKREHGIRDRLSEAELTERLRSLASSALQELEKKVESLTKRVSELENELIASKYAKKQIETFLLDVANEIEQVLSANTSYKGVRIALKILVSKIKSYQASNGK